MNRYMPGMLGAMLILIVPAFLICAGLAVVAYRKWQSSDEEPRLQVALNQNPAHAPPPLPPPLDPPVNFGLDYYQLHRGDAMFLMIGVVVLILWLLGFLVLKKVVGGLIHILLIIAIIAIAIHFLGGGARLS